jgi:predicted Rossmann fold flavoprotein
MMYDVVVVGGGAAGMLASAVAARRGARVALLESNNQLGKKLRITGKGRCNLTNECAIGEVLENIPTGRRFLQSALNGFAPRDAIELFESLGVPLKTERGGRVFPQSDDAATVADALWRYAEKSGVALVRGRARRITTEEGRVSGISTSVGEFCCTSAILATGGASYPATGSTGDGYKMASELGHKITPLRGSLVPLEAEADICASMQGLTLKNVRLTIRDGSKKPVFEDFGELLFTHFGMSGPLALSASAHMRDYDSKKYYALIDLKPALDEKKLDMRILRDFDKYSNRDFSNALGDLLSKTMIPVVIKKSGIHPGTKVNSISRERRLGLVGLLKAFRIDIDGPRPIGEAIITSGGIDVREINPKTMESKIIRGLHFAGEIIDADAYTGGFNLQIAWSTAHAAGTWVKF